MGNRQHETDLSRRPRELACASGVGPMRETGGNSRVARGGAPDAAGWVHACSGLARSDLEIDA